MPLTRLPPAESSQASFDAGSRRLLAPNHRRIAVFIDSDDRRRLDANVDREPQRSKGNHSEQHSEKHGAVGVGPKHAVMLVVLRISRDFGKRVSIPLMFSSHLIHLLSASRLAFLTQRGQPQMPQSRRRSPRCRTAASELGGIGGFDSASTPPRTLPSPPALGLPPAPGPPAGG